MNTFYIIANTSKTPALEAAQYISSYLEKRGAKCTVQGSGQPVPSDTYRYTDACSIPEDTEGVLVLGGDGTLLQASRDLLGTQLPLLGINLGTLGYLAEIEMASVDEALDALLEDRYTLENRMMLRGMVQRGNRIMLSDTALNDIVIGGASPMKAIDLNVYVNGSPLCAYRADGIILSTPTGSTGYSLSAGGPIVSPEASLLLLTAVAAHTLNARPLVLPDDVEVTIERAGRVMQGINAIVTFDGDTTMQLEPQDRIHIRKSAKSARLIKIRHTSFVELLRKKLS